MCRGALSEGCASGSTTLLRRPDFPSSKLHSHLGCKTCEHRPPCPSSSRPPHLGPQRTRQPTLLGQPCSRPSPSPFTPYPHIHRHPPIVPICSTVFPASSGRTSSPSTASRMVAASLSVSSRMSLPRAASARVAQGVTPASARAAALSWVRFHARTSAPWEARRRAILLPGGWGGGV